MKKKASPKGSRTQSMMELLMKHQKPASAEPLPAPEQFIYHLEEMIHGHADASWVRGLMKALVQFQLKNHQGSPDIELAAFLSHLIRYKPEDRRKTILALLPREAGPALKIIEKWEEHSRWRGQSGWILTGPPSWESQRMGRNNGRSDCAF